MQQLGLALEPCAAQQAAPAEAWPPSRQAFEDALRARAVRVDTCLGRPWFVGEFWSARQRQAHRLHEVSYRACFKPQLPAFFIQRLTREGDRVYDPFAGRGTSLIEAALNGRYASGNDINPLSRVLIAPRLTPPTLAQVEARLREIDFSEVADDAGMDLSMFFHERTLRELLALRRWLAERAAAGCEDHVDRWIRMVATNRLTGHSPGFFSVYTLPPNQAVGPEEQRRINARRGQRPEYRCVPERIARKSRRLLAGLTANERMRLQKAAEKLRLECRDAADPGFPPDGSVALTVTSPPFLDVVDYVKDNWLRCWFNGIDAEAVAARITVTRSLDAWRTKMKQVLANLHRAARPGGWLAFEVGEVRGGKVRLDEHVAELGVQAGWRLFGCLVQTQSFTKTANIWGVSNMTKGTNTQRIVMFYKDDGDDG